jgi:hypothetical protein
VTIEIADPKTGQVVDTITGTPNHPFFVGGKEGWIPLGELGIGTSLVTRAGPNGLSSSTASGSASSTLVVKSVRREAHPEGVDVYNFVVEGFHTYFVGTANGGVWVHNGLIPCNELVDLVEFRREHILNRHKAGVGASGKTEFPASWTDDEIMHFISDVATDPASTRTIGKWGEVSASGTRHGIDIRVDMYAPNSKYYGKISTGFPTNTPMNP